MVFGALFGLMVALGSAGNRYEMQKKTNTTELHSNDYADEDDEDEEKEIKE